MSAASKSNVFFRLFKQSVRVGSLLGGDGKVRGPGLEALDEVVLVYARQALAVTGQAHRQQRLHAEEWVGEGNLQTTQTLVL